MTAGLDRDTRPLADDALAWQDQAACLGINPTLFFPSGGEDARPAKTVCHGCEVSHECLEYAMTESIFHGIWGGLGERERRKLRRQRARNAAA